MGGKKILCVGLVCVDIINVVDHFPKEDTDQRNTDHRWSRGGNASNSCTVLSLLGAPCEYLGTIAVAPELNFIKGDFAAHGIDTSNVVYHEHKSTPLSIVILNSQNGSRTILHGNKSLPELTFEEFKKVDLSNKYKWIHFEARPTVLEIRQMLQHIDQYNESVVNPEVKIKTSVELEKSKPELETLANKVDVVFLSKDYAQYVGYQNKEEVAESFSKRCRPGATVICAWGEDGAIARTCDGSVFTAPIYPPARVVDTLGAGDTFNAATILSLSRGKSAGEAIQYGCKVAGAKCGMNGFDGLKELFKNDH